MDTLAEAFDPEAKVVSARSANGGEQQLEYDRLVIATGAEPVRPPIPGLELDGVQVVGPRGAQVAKRIDIFAAAIHCELRVEQLLDFDLSYIPPFAALWDAVQVAAQEWLSQE
jgi:NADPH-dependent 2,4-dienoyl-CoA reductase/sulfur reductase-like enzyme